jgi:hypothetical protein
MPFSLGYFVDVGQGSQFGFAGAIKGRFFGLDPKVRVRIIFGHSL